MFSMTLRCAIALTILVVSGCSTGAPGQGCRDISSWLASPESLVRRTTAADARKQFLEDVALDELPAALDKVQEQWFDEEWAKQFGALRDGDELWYYAEEKGDTGWWRKGYVALRGCVVVGEMTTLEDN